MVRGVEMRLSLVMLVVVWVGTPGWDTGGGRVMAEVVHNLVMGRLIGLVLEIGLVSMDKQRVG